MNHSQIVSFLWGVADLIRDTFKWGKYQDPLAQGNAYDSGPLQWRYLGNIFSGSVAVQGATWSKVKDSYREKGGAR